jgi:flagellar hook-associated protein 3 FlgL
MRISFANMFDQGNQAIATAAQELIDAQQRVSTGRRINAPSDDPLGIVSSIGARAVSTRMDAYTRAADAASSRLAVADSVLSDVVNQLTAAQTTALSARGSVPTQAQRDAAAGELLAIRDALLSDISTQFQGTYLFSGSRITTAPFASTGAGISAYQGDSSSTVIDVGTSRTAALSFDGGAIFQGSDATHVLDALTTLAAAVKSGDDAGIGAGLDALKRAFDRATSAQSSIGNNLKALDDGRIQITTAKNAADRLASKVENVDLAEAATRLAQAETAYRAALGAFATIGRQSLMDYLR